MPTESDSWPPSFTLDQERILNLLTGDRFYSNPSAALREAVLNAIDAIYRRSKHDSSLTPEISVTFDDENLTVSISDNGVGMDKDDISALFTKVGASAATAEANKDSVGEFGIGVISYFMAGTSFELHTFDGKTDSLGLSFNRDMLAGGGASNIPPLQLPQGTTIVLRIQDAGTFKILLDSYEHWFRDVEGLEGILRPAGELLEQGSTNKPSDAIRLAHPEWVERSHLHPVTEPTGWDSMTGNSNIAVLYRGVFVQEFEVRGLWGIDGSIDVDPKHFKPRLNREGFVAGQFQTEVEGFLRDCHPVILEAMSTSLAAAVKSGALDKWTEQRWASLWLSVPRSPQYAAATQAWDAIFRSIPAFELAVGNKWESISLEKLKELGSEVFVAPLSDERPNDIVRAALHLLRNTGSPVIRGIRNDKAWMRFAPRSYGTTADLISAVFADEIPNLISIASQAEQVLAEVERSAPLYTGPPSIDLVNLGPDSPPALRLRNRLVINADHPSGAAIALEVIRENRGAASLIAIAAKHAHEQLSEVAAAVRDIEADPEILSPVRRKYIRSKLQ